MLQNTPPESVSSDDQHTSHAIGMSDPQLQDQIRRKLDAMNRLHSTGVQIDIDLPQIAVIGSQSAGKSSLIEAISGITLPRQSGTCTRCPTECRLLKSDAPWQCVVSLRLTTDRYGKPLGQTRTHQFGDVMYRKADVEDRIRRAQLAILNPMAPPDSFLTNGTPSDEQLSFSANCITLQISGPDVANLSFCDLPGLIASVSSTRAERVNSIDLVKSLVVSYIEKPSCIILLTVACETDFENQGAHRLAKEYDPEGIRTVGVLTKPDRIPAGEESSWLPFIRNEKESLANNWFCVKQPSSQALQANITWDEARRQEDAYFRTQPWSQLDYHYQKHLGTNNLVERLVDLLSDLIGQRAPQMRIELGRTIQQTREAIAKLPPPPPSDPRHEIINMAYNFSIELARHIDGVPYNGDPTKPLGLIQAIRPLQEAFKAEIQMTAPCFYPTATPGEFALVEELWKPFFLQSEEGVDFKFVEHNAISGKGKTVRRIYLDEVLSRAQQARTRELPGHYPFVVQQSFIEGAVKQWKAPADVLCKEIFKIVGDHVQGLVHHHFVHFGQGKLKQRVSEIISARLQVCLHRAEDNLKREIERQMEPSTLHTHRLAGYTNSFLSYYQTARSQISAPKTTFGNANKETKTASPPAAYNQQDAVAKAVSAVKDIVNGMQNVTNTDLYKLFPDPTDPALKIMAGVRAYFQIAHAQFIDNVARMIDQDLVRGINRDLMPELMSRLGISGENGDLICKDFAQENRKVAARRAEFQKKLERLEAGWQEMVTAFE